MPLNKFLSFVWKTCRRQFFDFPIFRYLENGDRPLRRENPHKYLLYKPTLSQVLVFLASGFKELPANGALLLYLSADGCFSTTKHPEDSKYLVSLYLCLKLDVLLARVNSTAKMQQI